MKKFGKAILVMLAVIVGVPMIIVAFAAIMGFGAITMIVPGLTGEVIAILLLISIPGLIVGLIVGHNDKKNNNN